MAYECHRHFSLIGKKVEFKMTQLAKAILLALVLGVGHPVIGWGVFPAVFTEVSAQSDNIVCSLDGTDGWSIAGFMLAASSNPKAHKCLEDCARVRQRCEQQGAHRPGTKENIEWSRECQGTYNQCMNGCK
jgi:hypothetical protein